MPKKKTGIQISHRVVTVVTLFAIVFGLTVSAYAQTENVLFNFDNGSGGGQLLSGVVLDSSGNLYGTTSNGGLTSDCTRFGSSGCGVVYEVSPSGASWTESVLYSFTGGTDGGIPGAGVVRDAAGNLFGTTEVGGDNSACSGNGCGVVYELAQSGGVWHETVLYTFTGGTDGGDPQAGLILDAAGNLYGTTSIGGNNSDCPQQRTTGCGVVFKLSPASGGGWQETVIHTFTGNDGATPLAGLTFDSAGNLYGTTAFGGTLSFGVVFELAPNGAGGWKFGVIHNFTGHNDGAGPRASLLSNAGNLYGSADVDGADFAGVIFQLVPGSAGGWKFGVIHTFTGGHDGAHPLGALIADPSGNLYGTSEAGGMLSECFTAGCGVAFKLSPTSGGMWSESLLHTFTTGTDGTSPFAGVVFDSLGNLYGTTEGGGTGVSGTVYRIIL